MPEMPEHFILGREGPTESHDGELVEAELQCKSRQHEAIYPAAAPRKDAHEGIQSLDGQEACKANPVQRS